MLSIRNFISLSMIIKKAKTICCDSRKSQGCVCYDFAIKTIICDAWMFFRWFIYELSSRNETEHTSFPQR